MQNKITGVVLLIVCLVTLPGCWDRKEVEELAIITGMGLDVITENGREVYRVSYSILRPGIAKGGGQAGGNMGGGGGNQQGFYLVSNTGETIFAAGRDLSNRLSRRIFVAPIATVIVSDKLARMGADKFIDIFKRHKDFRLRTLIFVVKGEAMAALAAQPEFETSLPSEIRGIATNGQPFFSKGYSADMMDFLRSISGEERDAVTGTLEVVIPPENRFYSDKQKEAVGRIDKAITLSGAAVFKQGKLAGFLSNEDARGLLFVQGKARQGGLPLLIKEQQGDKVTISLRDCDSKIEPILKNGKLTINVTIKVTGDVYEHEGTEPIATPEMIKIFEKHMGMEVKRIAMGTINKAKQEFKADIFGFGEVVYQKNPKLWKKIGKKWRDEYFPKVDVKVTVKPHIHTTGQIGNSIEVK